ncbi:hypothetical protein HPB48_009578 [Haemaphysalis longicornis]|uniref:Uncharacterized protein n=1 Tax=Haemaphysalis longicornis TaxID=44386 RepID=A0A9J6FCM1_HAELO|nr:hypothetical protein HPB48_009578 [Haemaphysalis longicornis]
MDDACGRWERRRRACRLTDWHKWREARERRLGEQGGPNIVDIELWTRELLLDVEHHTRKIEAPDGVPAVDSHLLHIWDARESLTKRWRRQPLNRKLRRRAREPADHLHPPSLRTAYREILLEQRLGRRRFPAPHPSLTRMEEVLLRQLHTNTLPIPATLHKYYPDIYPTPQRPHCDQTGDLLHTMWHCTQNPNMKNITPNNRSTTQWEATLLNPHPACQKWLADRAERATRRPLAAPD